MEIWYIIELAIQQQYNSFFFKWFLVNGHNTHHRCEKGGRVTTEQCMINEAEVRLIFTVEKTLMKQGTWVFRFQTGCLTNQTYIGPSWQGTEQVGCDRHDKLPLTVTSVDTWHNWEKGLKEQLQQMSKGNAKLVPVVVMGALPKLGELPEELCRQSQDCGPNLRFVYAGVTLCQQEEKQRFSYWFLELYGVQNNHPSVSAVCVTVCKLLDYTRSDGFWPCV